MAESQASAQQPAKLNPADHTTRKHFSKSAHVLTEGERLFRYKSRNNEIEGRYVVESVTKTTATLTLVSGRGDGSVRVQRVSGGYDADKFHFEPIGEGTYPRPYHLETPEALAIAEKAANDAKLIRQAREMLSRFSGNLSPELATKVVHALSTITAIPE